MRLSSFQPGRWIIPRSSFAARLTLAMALLVALGVAGTTYVTSHIVRTTVIDRTGESFRAQAESLNDLVALFLLEKATELQVMAASETIKDSVAARNATYAGTPAEIQAEIQALDEQWGDAADNDPLISTVTSRSGSINPASHQLAGFLESFEAHSEVFVTDRYGATVGATGRLSDYYQADESWWTAGWNGGAGAVFISDPQFDQSAGVTALLIAAPVVDDETGEVIGVLRSTLNVDELHDLIAGVSFGQTGQALLVSASGETLFEAGPESEPAAVALPTESLADSAEGEPGFVTTAGTFLGYASIGDAGGRPGVASAAHEQALAAVAGLGWTTVVWQDSSEALASVGMIIRGGIIAGVIAVLVASAAALFLARAITRPLVDLNRAASQIGRGNLQAPLPRPGGDEVGQLATSFANMTARLRNLIDSLKARSVQLSRANEELQGEVADRKRAEEELRKSEGELTVRNRITGIFLTAPDEEMYGDVLRFVLDITESKHGVFGYLREDGALVCPSMTGDVWAQCQMPGKDIVFPPETWGGIWARALREKESLCSNEPFSVPDGHIPMSRALDAPIIHRGEVIGNLMVANKATDYDEKDQELLETVAGHIAPVLYARLQRERHEAERGQWEKTLRQSEEKYRHIFENVQDIYFHTEPTGTILELSPAVERFHYTREQLVGTSVLDIYEDPDERTAFVEELLKNGEVLDYELHLKAGDGRVVPSSASAFIRRGPDGTPVGIEGTLRDITERKQAEEALRESEERHRTLLENYVDGVALVVDGKITYVNPRFTEMLGYTTEDLQDRPSLDLLVTEERERGAERVGAILAGDSERSAEYRAVRKDGALLPVEVSARLLHFNGRTAILAVVRDITDRKRAEEALRASESKFRTMAETLAAAAFIWQGTSIRYVNPAAEAMTGFTHEELLAMNFWDVIHPDFRETVKQRGLARQRGEGTPSRYELMILTKGGEGRWVDFTGGTIEYEGQPAAIGTSFDITERKRAEEALRESESKFRTMAETLAAAAFIFQGYGIRYANAAAETITGYTREELLSVNLWDIIHPDSQEQVRKQREGRRQGEQAPMRYEVKIVTKGGAEKWVDFTGGPIEFEGHEAVLGTAFDVTERKRAEEALREQTRKDPLTGALNHAAIVDELRLLVAHAGDAARHGVAMIDVDALKAINDTYGHQVGDAVLIAIARALSRDGALVGRYGGDEFVVILPNADRPAAERYRTDVTAALQAARISDPQSGASVPAAISIGLAVFPDEADTVAELIQLSDSAMYAAKRQRPLLPDGLSTAQPQAGDRVAETVGHIVPFLTSPAQLEEKIRLVGQRIAVAAGYDAVNIDIFSQRTGPPNTRNVFAEVPQEVIRTWRGEQRPIEDDPFIQLVLRTRRGITVDDPQNDRRLTETQRNVLRAADLRSAAVVPLFWQDDLIGVLSVASKREGAITARDVQFLTTVATQVSAIVRMATLVDQLQSTSARLAQAQGDTVLLLAAAAEAHDLATGLHLQGVRALTQAVALELGYTDADASALGLAAVLHDIGKIRVPDSVLASPGPLPDDDWEIMKQHTIWGAEFLADRAGFELASIIALCHHERWDGTGYPQGLSGEAIPEAATIVTVADSFDAMTHDRPYRGRRSADQAVQEILAYSGKQFSPKVVAALKRLYQRGALVPTPTSAPGEEAAA